jgi:hypothetical protein
MMIDLKDHEETDDAMRVELTARINIIECKIKATQSRLQLLNHKPILSEGQYPNTETHDTTHPTRPMESLSLRQSI